MKLLLVTLLSSIILSGCNSGSSAGRTAIIDLDLIAQSTGRDRIISDKVTAFVKEKEKTVTKLRDELKGKLDLEEKKLVKKSKAAAKKKLGQLALQFEQKLRQDISLAKYEAEQLRANLVKKFRDEIQPEAIKIALRKGFSLVLIKQPSMLYIESSVNISNDIIAALSASQAIEPAADKIN